MKHLDANVLIAWHRPDHVHHGAVKAWCDDLLDRGEAFGAHDMAWTAFARICTNRRAFKSPSSIDDVFAFRHSVVAQQHHVGVLVGPDHWSTVENLCREHRVTANLVNDAVLAAAAISDGAALVSLDHDFSRFSELAWLDPSQRGR